jgi:hypothetical protein
MINLTAKWYLGGVCVCFIPFLSSFYLMTLFSYLFLITSNGRMAVNDELGRHLRLFRLQICIPFLVLNNL